MQRSASRGGIPGKWVTSPLTLFQIHSPPTFVPNGTPGPNIPGLEHMHAVEVLERFLPLKFWAGFTQETNAYHDRCQKDPSNADPDKKDVETALNGQPHAKAGWQHDYDGYLYLWGSP